MIIEQPLAPDFAVVDEVLRAHASEFAACGFALVNANEHPPVLLDRSGSTSRRLTQGCCSISRSL
jgi:hypothetical protein